MRIKLTSVMVENQDLALAFYTGVLGFVKRIDLPAGAYRWLTVVSPDGPDDIELVLEPNAFPPARTYQKALFDAGIPAASFAVNDIHAEYERLTEMGVAFSSKPAPMGTVTVAICDDTCGNLIQLYQV